MVELKDAVAGYAKRIKVCEVAGMTKVRLGNEGDGGYVVLEELCNQTGTVSSYGVGDDVGFELAFLERWPTAVISLFDPYIEGPPVDHPSFLFYRTGAGERYPGGLAPADLLKMDVEGDEWSALRTCSWMTLLNCQQIVVELHAWHVIPPTNLSPYFNAAYKRWADGVNARQFREYASVMELLNTWFVCFHAHANNSLPMVELGGVRFPPLLELSFARRGLVGDIVPFTGSLPVEGLDFPNKADRPDIIDWYPLIGRKHGFD